MSRRWIAAALFIALLPFTALAQEVTRYLLSYDVPSGQKMDEVVCIGCSVTVAGSVAGDLIAIGGDLDISGAVQGDAIAVGGRIRLRPGGAIEGDAVTVGGSLVREGQVRLGSEPDEVPYFHLPGQRSLNLWGVVTIASVNMLLALVCAGLLRFRRLENIATSLRRNALRTVVLGLILSGVWILLVVLSDNTPRPVAVTLWVVHGALLLLLLAGCAGLAWLAGNLALPRVPGIAKLALGALIWTGLSLVPLAGALAFVVALVLALGAAVRSRFGFSAMPQHE